ncbi:MAG: DNA polymerase III subunit delta [bacterium]|nr:DNA polymerase III subunit delta [bacterium]
MIIFLYGPDAYRLQQTRQNIIKEYLKKHSSGVNIFHLDLLEIGGLDKLLDTIKSLSFFSEHKLIVTSNAFSKKTTADEINNMIGIYDIASAPDITLLLTEPSNEKGLVAKNKVLFKLVTDKINVVKIFNPLDGVKLAQWIQQEFKFRNCSIDHDALNKLINTVGNDSWTLVNEIEKLTAYAGAREIGIADVNLLVNQSKELNVFDLIDAIGSQNRKKAFELLYSEIKTGRDPYYILTMITYQFRNLLTVKDLESRGLREAEISKKSQLHPFVVRKSIRSPIDTKVGTKIYGNLLAIDTAFKNGQIDLLDSLYRLVI